MNMRSAGKIAGSAALTAAVLQSAAAGAPSEEKSANVRNPVSDISFTDTEYKKIRPEKLVFLHPAGDTSDQKAPDSTAPVWPVDTLLSFGDEGFKVKKLQKALHQLGYYKDNIDGVFGPKTKQGVSEYQADYGLNIDGLAGNETLTHLFGVKSFSKINVMAHPSSQYITEGIYKPLQDNTDIIEKNTPDPPAVTYFQYGDRDEKIKRLQKQLKMAGYFNETPDGYYDSYTQSAVRSLQKDHNLMIDGLAGKEVKAFLNNYHLETVNASAPNRSSEKESNDKHNTASAANENEDSPGTLSSENSFESVIAEAKKLTGTPYQWGGTSPSGFDCSGFLTYVYQKSGIDLPRSVSEIWTASSPVSTPRPGDLIFFETYTEGPSHAGIYLGQGRFIHSGSSTGVTVSDTDGPYWSSRYLGIRRITD